MNAPTPAAGGRANWLAAGALTLVIVGLHAWLLGHAGAFCGDEVNVLNLAATHSPSLMVRDSFPLLFPTLVGGWQAIGLGRPDLALRALGFLIGLGLVGALWLAAWSARRSPPLAGLVLFGMNGMAIYWSDYLRAYGLGSLLIVLTLAAMCFLLERPTWRRTAILTVAAVLSVQTLYQNAVFFAAISFGGWAVCWRRKDKDGAGKILAAALVAALSLLPYWGAVSSWAQATTIRPGFSAAAALDNLHTMLAFPAPQYVWLWALLGLAVIGVGAIAWFRRATVSAPADQPPATGEQQLFAGAVLLFSLAGYWGFLHVAALITSPWYFLPLMAVGAACFEAGLPLAGMSKWPRVVAVGVLTGTAALAAPFAARDLNCRFSNMDLVANRLAQDAAPQDYIVVLPWYLGISFNRYYHGPANWDSLPPMADHSTYRFDLVPVAAADIARARQPVLERMGDALQTGHRVWVVGWMSIPTPPHAASTVEGRFLAEHSQTFKAVNLKIKGQTSDYEDASLLLASGWKTNQP